MSTINRVLVAFFTFTSPLAIPLDSSVDDSARIETRLKFTRVHCSLSYLSLISHDWHEIPFVLVTFP